MAALRRVDVERFFRSLARSVPVEVTLVLTGGSEAMLLGGRRPTADIDFGVATRSTARWAEIEAAIADAARAARVVVQYSEDIDRWSSISIPARRRKSRLHRRLGRLTVRLLDPACWAVYKLARYLDSDVDDLIAVMRAERVSGDRLARLCGESLRASPRSPSLFAFRNQVEHFFLDHGVTVWGEGFRAERAVAAFHRAASIAPPPRRGSRLRPPL